MEALMHHGRIAWLLAGVVLGALTASMYTSSSKPVFAGGNDRHEDFILCTGAAAVLPNVPTDGIWLLDYRKGKLLGTLIDRMAGRIMSWAEVDLVNEFGVQPGQDVHFLMTTGQISQGQAALYLAETTTGRFAVYTMGPRPDGRGGIAIRRHDLVTFRN